MWVPGREVRLACVSASTLLVKPSLHPSAITLLNVSVSISRMGIKAAYLLISRICRKCDPWYKVLSKCGPAVVLRGLCRKVGGASGPLCFSWVCTRPGFLDRLPETKRGPGGWQILLQKGIAPSLGREQLLSYGIGLALSKLGSCLGVGGLSQGALGLPILPTQLQVFWWGIPAGLLPV